MSNKFLKLEHIAHKKSSYTLRMILSEIGLHSFSTYTHFILSSIIIVVHEERLAMSCENNKIMDHQNSHLFNCFLYKLQILIIKTIFEKLHLWIWAFCSHIDLCIVHLHFLRGMNLQFSTIAVRMHFFIFYMWICADFGARFTSIGVEFVLGTKRTLKRNLVIATNPSPS